MKRYIILILCLAAVASQAQHNTLSSTEKKEGWQLLFDGKTTKGWHTYKSAKAGEAWKISEDALFLDTSNKEAKGGDLVTDQEFENYELYLEWKIQPCGNSGVIFNVQESDEYKYVWLTGPEMQVLDNECHPDAKIIKHRAGDLYDLISCSQETVKPAGEWNAARLISNKGKYEFWLNGVKTVAFTMHTPEWDAMVAGSKFKSMAGFGKFSKGRIALQDHGDQVWYRNIKIKPL
ncbi:MAG: DUF1080 domain-containing protein [Cyclobacteriaceae bacterium]|nr:DUF1080 domain-containing protein [Cyclobacteriaceae bacterium]